MPWVLLLISMLVADGCHLVAGYQSGSLDGGAGSDSTAPDDSNSGTRDFGGADACDGVGCNSFSRVQLPGGGHVQRLSLTRNHSANLYAMVSTTRVFRSTDRTATWTPCTPPGGPLSALAAIADQPLGVLVGTPGQVLASNDGCQSWVPTGLPRRAYSLLSLGESDHLAGTNDGLFRYQDGAWAPLDSPLSGHRVERIVADPSGQFLFASASTTHVVRSLDGADSWQLVDTGLPNGGITDLAIDDANPKRAHVLFTEALGLYRTEDRGDSWERTFWLGGSTVAVDPHDPDFVAAYLWHRLASSTTGGYEFTGTDRRTPNMGYALVDALKFDPAVENRLYAATHRGLFVASDRQWQWMSSSVGLGAWTINGIATDPTRGHIYLATSAGLLRSTDRGTTWSIQTTGLGPKSFASTVALGPNGSTLWVTGEYIAQSTNGGETHDNQFTPRADDDYQVNAIAFSSTELYAGTSARLLTHTIGSSVWAPSLIADSRPLVNDLLVQEGPPTRVWIATNSGIFFTDDDGASFTDFDQNLGNQDVRALALLQDGSLLAGTAGGIYAFSPGGTAWTRRGPATMNVSDLLARGGTVVAACGSGVYASPNQGNTWALLPGLEAKLPRSLGLDLQGNLLVGTTGFGLYTRPWP